MKISEKERGEEERSSHGEVGGPVTAVLVTDAVVDHHLQYTPSHIFFLVKWAVCQ